MAWEPDRYLQFSDERLRPAVDLLGRVNLAAPVRIVDLGCGAGNVTRLLHTRWPDAAVSGVDNSPEMLARAQQALPSARFECVAVEAWQPEGPVDLVFSNAALHWVGEHAQLFPRLMTTLADGGVLAVQMPGNFAAPSHRLIRELAESAAWRGRLGRGRMGAILEMEAYFRLLSPHARCVTLWETTYWQALTGRSPVLDWLRGTTLVPYLTPLDAADQSAFLAELGSRLDVAYPPDAHGVTLFPFRRVFLVAQR